MEEYLAKQNELSALAEEKANEIVTNLISNCAGKNTSDLRSMTLDFIHHNQVPEVISFKLKIKIDNFISNLKIPAQGN